MAISFRSAFVFAALCFAPLGCRQSAAPAASAGPVRHYPITGRVVGENLASGELEINAAPIPGFMDAMTMPYKVKDPATLKQVHQGDRIAGVLQVDGNGTLLDQVKVTDSSKEMREPVPQSLLKPLVAGEAVPDFALLDQSNHIVHLSDFHGKILLVTFVYTHCPLSDYCPRMSRNFAEVDKSLAATPALYSQTHLLTISFDPARDTPAVLRSYGGAYTGRYTAETFDHWTFAAPRASTMPALLSFFDIGAVPAPGGTLTHTLSTVEIGPDGRILKWFGGNDWTSDMMLADIRQALGAGSAGAHA